MTGAHRSAPLPSAEYLIPTGVTCAPVCLGGSWHSAAVTQSPGTGCPHWVLFQPGAGRDPWTPQCSPKPQDWPLRAGVALPLHVTAHPWTVSPLCPLCPAVLLALDWLQLWPGPAGDLHQPLHHLQAQHAEPAVQQLRQPAATPQHRLQVPARGGLGLPQCCQPCWHEVVLSLSQGVLLRRNSLCWKNMGDWSDFTVVSPGYAWPRSMAVGRWFAAGQRAIRSWRWRRTRCVCGLLSCWNLNGGVQGMKKMLRSHQCFWRGVAVLVVVAYVESQAFLLEVVGN